MQDISARELKGHNILATKRFMDGTCHMIEFIVSKRGNAYGLPGDEVRLFLNEAEYKMAMESQKQGEIRIKKDAHVIEGHIVVKKKRRRH